MNRLEMRKTVSLLIGLAGFFLSASGQQKRVLLEMYTSAHCGACPNGHLVAEELAASYPELSLAFHHSSVDGMANPNSTEWRNNFGVFGTPMGMVDRNGPAANQIPTHPQNWEERLLARLNEPAIATIELQGNYDRPARQLSLDVTTTFTQRPPAGELRLNLMILEDSVIHAGYGFNQSNYYNDVEGHPLYGLGQPIHFYPHHHVVREIVDDTWGTPGVFPEYPEPGQSYAHHYDYYVTWNWDHEKVKLLVFVSLFDENAPLERQVLNVVELPLFSPLTSATEASSEAAGAFTAFPNPVKQTLHLSFPPDTHLLEILSPSGMALHSQAVRSETLQIDVSGLPAGLYLARALSPAGAHIQKILIRNH